MELYQLQTFITVAREKNQTRAAEKLNTSQPAVSAHIKTLEEELGYSLFQRTSTGMQLTAGGKLLCKKAEKILREVEEFTQLGANLHESPKGTIRIGMNKNAEFLRIKPFYQRLRSNYPDIEIVLQQSISGIIIKLIKTNELDCGFIFGNCEETDITLLHLTQFKLRVVGPVDFQKLLENADLSALAELPWIGLSDDCAFSQIMTQYFFARGLKPRTELTADRQSVINSMIESGIGLNFMFEEDALEAKEKGEVAIWPGESFPLDLSFAFRTKNCHSARLNAVRKTMAAIWTK
jgi:DNA-binding transcriptional LysR family regulator